MSTNQTYNEQELVLRIAESDERAFAQFYAHFYNIIRPFIVRNTASASVAAEIIQLTFLRVWLNRYKLPEITNIKAWLIKIAAREYLTYMRGSLSRQAGSDSLETITHAVDKPEHSYSVKEIRQLVAAAVKNLSAQRKQVFHLSRNEHRSIQEIAEMLGIAPKTVKNTLTAALSEIRTYLRAHDYDLYLVICLGFHQIF